MADEIRSCCIDSRCQHLKIRSWIESYTWDSACRILNKLGYYTDYQYAYMKEDIHSVPYASKEVWAAIDHECEIIKNLTGVELYTSEEIRAFEKTDLTVYKEQNKLKSSLAGKLIDISDNIIGSDNAQYAGVYLIVNNKTLDFYIGESQNISLRKKTHIGDLALSNHSSKSMQEHFNQYGVNAFDFYCLEHNGMEDENVRKYAEKRWIKEYQPTYN